MNRSQQNIIIAIILNLLLFSPVFAPPLGQTFNVGETALEMQPFCAVDRTIALDPQNGVHIVWTAGDAIPEIKYNFYRLGNNFYWQNGISVSQYSQSFHPAVGLWEEQQAVISTQVLNLGQSFTSIYIDQGWAVGNFDDYLIPNPPDQYLFFPRLAIDARYWVHILAYTASDAVNLRRGLYYNRSEDGGLNWVGWTFVDSVRVLTGSLVASAGGKVAMAWSHPLNPLMSSPLEMGDNDIYYCESEDGQVWDFSPPVNLTDFQNGVHPLSDSIRAFCDLSLLYDEEENLHFAYTCTGYIIQGGHIYTTPGSLIYHYSANTGFTNITGNLSWGPIQLENRRRYDLPSLGFYEPGEELYCIWSQFNDFSDTSAAGYVNGEVWGAYSEDRGLTWSTPIDLTNTHDPASPPGSCRSEDFPSLAPVINDTLHFCYLLDWEPGPFSNQFISDIKYQKVSTEEFKNASNAKHRPGLVPCSINKLCNYPNPFNKSTTVYFDLPAPGNYNLTVHNLEGKEVLGIFTNFFPAGVYQLGLDMDDFASGIYFLMLSSPSLKSAHKMVLIK